VPLDANSVRRAQTRPIGEFGGNIGGGFWTVFVPLCIWYFYGCAILDQGSLHMPPWDSKWWGKLYYDLPDGIAIRPTFEGWYMYVLWVIFQMVMEMVLPGKIVQGVKLKNGNRLRYPMNGLFAYFLSHVAVFVGGYYEFIDPTYVWKNMGALLTGGVISTFLVSLWQYIDFGLGWKRHVNDPEFEEDWGVFDVKECLSDFWLGVARNPRYFHKLMPKCGGFDIKRFSNARAGLTIWIICNWSYMAAIYFGCQLKNGQPVCEKTGDFNRIGYSAIFISLAHWYYIFDYNWVEPAYLTTTDLRHDLYGYMLAYGCCGFLAWYYPIAFMGHIAGQKEPLAGNHLNFGVGVTLYLIGMFLFRRTNIEKHRFRTYIANEEKVKGKGNADLSKYKVWGKPVEYIKTEEGSYLLCSGYWALARHFNYIGDMVMCVGWTVACGGPKHGFPWVPLSYVVYFWIMDLHRLWRDEERCERKYKKDWIAYKEKVPRFILPGIF
jgi:7-dehydrocholesterol reductase